MYSIVKVKLKHRIYIRHPEPNKPLKIEKKNRLFVKSESMGKITIPIPQKPNNEKDKTL